MYKKVKCKGGLCHYLECGDGGKGNILLLHGYADSAKTFRPLCEIIGDRYRIVIPDLPMIRRKGVSYDLQGLSSFVNEFVKKVGLKKFILCGFSFGGLVAADYSYWYPKRVKKLYMLNSVPRFLSPEMLEKLLVRLEPDEVPRFIYSLYAYIRSTKPARAIWPKSERLERTIKNISDKPFAILGTVYEVIRHNIIAGTWTERVRKFNKMPMPKAVILFKDDEVISYEKYATKLKRSGVNVITFDKGGHAQTKDYWDNLSTLFK